MLGPRRLKKCLGLDGQERRLFLRAFIDLANVDLALRFTGSQRVLARAWSFHASERDMTDSTVIEHARRYARLVEAAARHHIIRARCLHCSLVLHRWLQQENLPSALRIGVRKVAGRMQAHAWVEVAGQVVNDTGINISTFIPLSSPLSRPLSWTHLASPGFARVASGLDSE